MCLGVELLGHAVILYLTFWGTAKLFSTAAAHFTFPPAVCYGLAFSIFLLLLFSFPPPLFLKLWRLSVYGVLSHMGWFSFVLYFSNEWCWASFHVLVGHLYIFFEEMSVQIICPFLIGCLFSFCWIIRFLYIIWICHLSGMWFANIFLQSVACLFIFLVVSFEAQKLILMKSDLPVGCVH